MIVPVLPTLAVDRVKLLFVLVLLFSTKLPVPDTPPVTVKVPAVSVRVVPALATVIAVVVMLSGEVPFSIMLVTVAPTPPLIKVMPEPLPLLVIVPVLPTLAVESVIPLVIALLLLSTKLPVPVTPPDRVSSELPLALLLVKVVMLLPPCMVSAPLTFKAEVVLFSVMPVTRLPTPALTNVAPVPVPLLVITPALFTLVVDRVKLLFVLVLLFSTKLPVPVTPPVTVKMPRLSVRVVPALATVIAVVVMLSGE